MESEATRVVGKNPTDLTRGHASFNLVYFHLGVGEGTKSSKDISITYEYVENVSLGTQVSNTNSSKIVDSHELYRWAAGDATTNKLDCKWEHYLLEDPTPSLVHLHDDIHIPDILSSQTRCQKSS